MTTEMNHCQDSCMRRNVRWVSWHAAEPEWSGVKFCGWHHLRQHHVIQEQVVRGDWVKSCERDHAVICQIGAWNTYMHVSEVCCKVLGSREPRDSKAQNHKANHSDLQELEPYTAQWTKNEQLNYAVMPGMAEAQKRYKDIRAFMVVYGRGIIRLKI